MRDDNNYQAINLELESAHWIRQNELPVTIANRITEHRKPIVHYDERVRVSGAAVKVSHRYSAAVLCQPVTDRLAQLVQSTAVVALNLRVRNKPRTNAVVRNVATVQGREHFINHAHGRSVVCARPRIGRT